MEALTALSGGFGRRYLRAASVLAAFVALGVVITPSTAYAECGWHNENACCSCDRSGNPCNSGLFEVCGRDACVPCSTDSCAGGCCCFGAGLSNGICVDLHPCGGLNQRACCVGESGRSEFEPACNAGLIGDGSCNKEFGRKQCGCDRGPTISAGVCRTLECGGEGERACYAELLWRFDR